MTYQPFVRPGDVVRPPQTGGKIALEPPIVAPIRCCAARGHRRWITLVVGAVGLIVAMYVWGMRTFATGFGFFGSMAVFSMVGMVLRACARPRRCRGGVDEGAVNGSPARTISAMRSTSSGADSGSIGVISIGIWSNWPAWPARCGCGTAPRQRGSRGGARRGRQGGVGADALEKPRWRRPRIWSW